MQHFYKHIIVELKTMRFYTKCDICGKKVYAGKMPLLCASQQLLHQLEHGKVKDVRQRLYNHKKALAVQYLARFFNQCGQCGKWVCDDCYNDDVDEGICSNCTTEKVIST